MIGERLADDDPRLGSIRFFLMLEGCECDDPEITDLLETDDYGKPIFQIAHGHFCPLLRRN